MEAGPSGAAAQEQEVRQVNTAAQAARSVSLWRRAVRRITHILRIRRKWALVGQLLQDPTIQDLVRGLERRQGQLVRRRPANIGR